MKMRNAEPLFFGVCIAFFAFMDYQAINQMGKGRAGEIGSGFWPFVALTACVVLSAVQFFRSLRRTAPQAGSKEHTEENVSSRRRALVLTVISFLLYLIAIPWIGFVAATFFFIPAVSASLGERRWKVLCVSPVVITFLITMVFARFIAIPFPRGVGLFASFSRLLY